MLILKVYWEKVYGEKVYWEKVYWEKVYWEKVYWEKIYWEKVLREGILRCTGRQFQSFAALNLKLFGKILFWDWGELNQCSNFWLYFISRSLILVNDSLQLNSMLLHDLGFYTLRLLYYASFLMFPIEEIQECLPRELALAIILAPRFWNFWSLSFN